MTQAAAGPRALEELVQAAIAGHPEATDQLMTEQWPLIRAIVQARVSAPQRPFVDDLSQEVAIRLLRQIPTHEWRGHGAFRQWVRRLADSVVIDALRHEHAQRRDSRAQESLDAEAAPAPTGPSMESQVHARRLAALFELLVKDLPPDDSAAVLLARDGYTQAEIGELLACSEEAARKRVKRAMGRLTSLAARLEAIR